MKLVQKTYEAPKVLESQKIVFETKVSGIRPSGLGNGIGNGKGKGHLGNH
jgi:hypothetical protein